MWVALDKFANPGFDERLLSAHRVPPAQGADDQGTQGIDDHVPHGIGQS